MGNSSNMEHMEVHRGQWFLNGASFTTYYPLRQIFLQFYAFNVIFGGPRPDVISSLQGPCDSRLRKRGVNQYGYAVRLLCIKSTRDRDKEAFHFI